MHVCHSAIAAIIIFFLILTVYDTQATTGKEWRQFSKTSRKAYVWGVFDTWQNIEEVAEMINAKTKVQSPNTVALVFTKLVRCISQRMTYKQLNAIVDKYIEDNPALWHNSMPSLVWIAIHSVCEATSK